MKQTILRKYARLIARSGVNIQKGQDVNLVCGLDQPKFVELLVDECYKAGARKVKVDFTYQPLEKLHVRHQSVTTMAKVEEWEKARYQHYIDTLPCRIYLDSEDPDGLKGINQKKLAQADQKRYPIIKPLIDQMENKYQWCIAAVPGAAWAKKMFPELPKGKAMEKLWEAILFTSRVTDDPVAAWQQHNDDLHKRCDYLNSLGISELHYKGANGTDLKVGMIPQAQFKGGGDTTLKGVFFNPNIPRRKDRTMAVNPDGSYTDTTQTGYISRIGGSFKGIGAGIVMLIAATGLLWWIEGRATRTGDAILTNGRAPS